ncbi:MAG: hypothetical protein IT178_05035 [Acidobacteria bacterium]|nr:hypothetical protein [Acidobacteriota bacterium]
MNDKTPAQIIPNLLVASVDKTRGYFIDTLGFDHTMGMVGKDGQLDFCMVQRAGAMVMLTRPDTATPPGVSAELYIEVHDPDAYLTEVTGRGATVVDPLTTQWWGYRNFSVQDPQGYKLWFYKTVQEFTPAMVPPGMKMV